MDSRNGDEVHHQQVLTAGTWMFQPDDSSMQCPYFVQSPLSSSSAVVVVKAPSTTRSDDDTTPLRKQQLVIVDHGRVAGFRKEQKEEDDDDDGYEEEEEYYYEKIGSGGGGGWRSYCSLRRSSSCAWIWVQLCWRFLVSLGPALLVFYLVTKPPPPKVTIKVGGMREFLLAEGVDSTGVTTKILTCNCSLNLLIENKSKLFGLHINPPLVELSFRHLPIAVNHRGSKYYADIGDSSSTPLLLTLHVGTRNKPMYGAGRNMQELMESGRGLPMVVRVRFSSYFRVVSNFIRAKFHHEAECTLSLGKTYDEKHRTQTFRSYCTVVS